MCACKSSATPVFSDNERLEALKMANKKRSERARLLKSGDFDVVRALREPPNCLLGAKLYSIVVKEPKLSCLAVKTLLESVGATEKRVNRKYRRAQLEVADEIEAFRAIYSYNRAHRDSKKLMPIWYAAAKHAEHLRKASRSAT